jgi:hypothetical protein
MPVACVTSFTHPNVANIYRAKVATFTEALDDPDGGAIAAEAIRSLIGYVVLRPGRTRGQVEAELCGELMASSTSPKTIRINRLAKSGQTRLRALDLIVCRRPANEQEVQRLPSAEAER